MLIFVSAIKTKAVSIASVLNCGSLIVHWSLSIWNFENKLTPLFSLFVCRLALYVYEYLLHVGAQKSAQTFLSEVSHKEWLACLCVSQRV